jgi:hypothetical protein
LSGDLIVPVIAVLAALVLALRGLQVRPTSWNKRLTMAAMWLLIIVVLVFVLGRLGLGR